MVSGQTHAEHHWLMTAMHFSEEHPQDPKRMGPGASVFSYQAAKNYRQKKSKKEGCHLEKIRVTGYKSAS